MVEGDTSVQIVKSPINATTISTAVVAALVATNSNANLLMTSYNDGRGIVIIAKETA